jgi:alkanesulfonate monooxygenase SsuD/methylene tetrahydromethanopterin reductase-like flavin-dependent oxidoreductase (luciferase family)
MHRSFCRLFGVTVLSPHRAPVSISHISPTAVEIRDHVQVAQDLGYAHIGFSEHVSSSAPPFPPGLSFDELWHESFTLLAFLAAITTDIELNTGMTLLTLRPAALAAKQAAEVDLLSGGRLRLGVSVGWQRRELEAVGVDPSTRGARIEEQIEAMRLLWTQPLVTYHGAHVVLDEVALHPRTDRGSQYGWVAATSTAVMPGDGRSASGTTG